MGPFVTDFNGFLALYYCVPLGNIQLTMARQRHQKRTPDFHDKLVILVGPLCVAIWVYAATQIGILWNLSPASRVTPKEWRDQ
uniref:Cytochrome c oxidase subunit 7B, mitochondrial n=1 Tax=Monodon monoceros TaxID=40151 RepID=A0A8C6BCM1_MONMO